MKTLVVGIGNRLFGDDYIGSLLVELLSKTLTAPNVNFVSLEHDMYALLSFDFEKISKLVIVDAALIEEDYKVVKINSIEDLEALAEFSTSSHGLSVTDILRIVLELNKKLLGNTYLLFIKVDNLELRECITENVVFRALQLLRKLFELTSIDYNEDTIRKLEESLRKYVC